MGRTLRALWALLFCLWVPALQAAGNLEYLVIESGRREELRFYIPPDTEPPQGNMVSPNRLQVAIPGLLALPFSHIDLMRSQLIERFQVEERPAGEMGIFFNLDLREPMLQYREFLEEPLAKETRGLPRGSRQYRLVVERPPLPKAAGSTLLQENLVMPGRDGTLLVFSFTGAGRYEQSLDLNGHLARLTFPGAQFERGWQPPPPSGLVDNLVAYQFAGKDLEVEVGLHPDVGNVQFHHDATSGTLIMEIVAKNGLGRGSEAKAILARRAEAVASGHVLPLNRLTPFFLPQANTVQLADKPVSESYFWDTARKMDRDHQFPRARSYLDNLLTTFPESPNAEVVRFYRIDILSRMNVRPGWLHQELLSVLSRYPNHYYYPRYRMLLLQTLNDGSLYESAIGLVDDPNLPHRSPLVELERGRANFGLRRFDEATSALEKVVELEKTDTPAKAHAYYLLARIQVEKGHPEEAAKRLAEMPREIATQVYNQPRILLETAQTFASVGNHAKALEYFIHFLNFYPGDAERAPWARLGAAVAMRQTGQPQSALTLFNQLLVEYPDSEAASWARVYRLQLQPERPLADRLKELDEFIGNAPLTGAMVEAYITKAEMQGDAGMHREALDSLNKLMRFTAMESIVARADRLKHRYMVAGMAKALQSGRPEYAVLLAESHGNDWRAQPEYADARTHLAEAMLAMGMTRAALDLLDMARDNGKAPDSLRALGESLLMGNPPDVDPARLTPETARVRVDQARRLANLEQWEGILLLLEKVPDALLSEEDQSERLRLLARAEAGRGRFPQAAEAVENLFYNRSVGDGYDYFWYAKLVQGWKGDLKALPIFRKVADEATKPEFRALGQMRIGEILQRQGDLPGAQEAFRQAGSVDPQGPWVGIAREHVGQLELMQSEGKPKAAGKDR
ncbi:MAG: tetratricopeptide repeat protein [Magnetococcales bacterium]|nr:tetratricopeptide repeat protein [Magnetococcales bacterium]